MRGKSSGVQAIIPDKSPESSYFSWGTIFNEKQTMWQVLVTLLHTCGFGVLCNEVWVVYMDARDEAMKN